MRALLLILALTACATPDFRVPEAMLTCPEEVEIPDGRLTDNQIAGVIEELDARGDICADKLRRLREWLGRSGAVIRDQTT